MNTGPCYYCFTYTGIHKNYQFGTDKVIGWAIKLVHPDLKSWLDNLKTIHHTQDLKLYGTEESGYFPLSADAM